MRCELPSSRIQRSYVGVFPGFCCVVETSGAAGLAEGARRKRGLRRRASKKCRPCLGAPLIASTLAVCCGGTLTLDGSCVVRIDLVRQAFPDLKTGGRKGQPLSGGPQSSNRHHPESSCVLGDSFFTWKLSSTTRRACGSRCRSGLGG